MTETAKRKKPELNQILSHRSRLLAKIRHFFATAGVMEVETPVLLSNLTPDPFIDYFHLSEQLPQVSNRYLAASPEAAMKKLLAAGSGPIYQLCKAFRRNDLGAWHNPEFTILEWYRPGYGESELQNETAALIEAVLDIEIKCKSIRYKDLFTNILNVDPHRADDSELSEAVSRHSNAQMLLNDRSECLHYLFSHCIEPQLADWKTVYVTEYPACEAGQASLGLDSDGIEVARRFELYQQGVELANGNIEENDPVRLRHRFDRLLSQWPHKSRPKLDEDLLSSLHSMPPVAGIALGVDRLLALKVGSSDIQSLLSFNWNRS